MPATPGARRPRRRAALAALTALFGLLGTVAAQAAMYVDEVTGFQLVPPPGWVAEAGFDDDGDRFVTFTRPSGDAMVLVGASTLDQRERDLLASGGVPALLETLSAQLLEEFPGSSVTDLQLVEVAGTDAGILSFQAEGVIGAMLLSVLPDARAFTVAAIAAEAIVDEVASDLTSALMGFVPPASEGAPPVAAADTDTPIALAEVGVSLTVPAGWRVEESPGLERSLLQGRRETVEQDGTRIERTVLPDVRSMAAYGADGAAMFVHAYRARDLPASLEARSDALTVAFDSQLIDFQVLATEEISVAGAQALATTYLATDPYDLVRYRGRALVLDGPDGPLLLVLEAPAEETERHAAAFESVVASVTLARSAPLVGPGAEPPHPFAGHFSDGRLSLTLEPDGADYVGTIHFDGRRFQVRASADGWALAGTFTSDGADFAFRAEYQGATLVFETGGAHYRLHR